MKISLLVLLSCFSFFARAQVITTVAGNGIFAFGGDGGPATAASIRTASVRTDAFNNIYLSEMLRIRKVDVLGNISTIAGNDTALSTYMSEGLPARDVYINGPEKVAADLLGNLYFREAGRVRKINSAGVLTTVAGGPLPHIIVPGTPATSAGISYTADIAVDGIGNIFITDPQHHYVYKVGTDGIINVLAGNGIAGPTGDGGPATAASLGSPRYVAVDNAGNVYITDHTRVRKVNSSGIITTIVGGPGYGYTGDGGPATAATFAAPGDLATDNYGNLFISDRNNAVIRKVDAAGIITTYAGNGTFGFSGDGGPATAAQLDRISAIACNSVGDLFSVGENRVRKIAAVGVARVKNVVTIQHVSIMPDPCAGSFTIDCTMADDSKHGARIEIMDIAGRVVYSSSCTIMGGSLRKHVELNEVANGIYFLRLQIDSQYSYSRVTVYR